jgi:hypothetical protein
MSLDTSIRHVFLRNYKPGLIKQPQWIGSFGAVEFVIKVGDCFRSNMSKDIAHLSVFRTLSTS